MRILLITSIAMLLLTTAVAQVPRSELQRLNEETPASIAAKSLVRTALLPILGREEFTGYSLESYKTAYALLVQAETLVDQPKVENEYSLKAGTCLYLAQIEHFVLKDPAAAESHYRCAEESADRMGRHGSFLGPLSKNQILTSSYKSLTALFMQQKRLNEAYGVLRHSIDIDESDAVHSAVFSWEDSLPAERSIGPMGFDIHYLWLNMVLAQNLRDLDPSDRRFVDLAWEASIRSKGRTIDVYRRLLSRLRSGFPEYFASYSDFISAVSREELAHLAPSPSLANDELDELTKAVLETLDAKSKKRPAFGSWHSYASDLDDAAISTYTLEKINDQLPADAAIIEYVKYPVYELSDVDGSWKNWGASRYSAFVKTKNRDVVSVKIGDSSTIDDIVKDLRLAISLRDSASTVKQIAGRLGTYIFDPLEPSLQGVNTLFFVTDGELEIAPMSAICDKEGRFLVETYSIAELGNPQEISSSPRQNDQYSRSLVIGDPDFGPVHKINSVLSTQAKSPSSTDDYLRFDQSSIAHTRAEVTQVASILRDATLLRGKLATEEAVKAASAPRVLHIASHGYYLDTPDSNYANDWGLFLAPWSQHNKNVAHRAVGKIDPDTDLRANFVDSGVKIGIALADANLRKSSMGSRRSQYNDGILTGTELMNINLRGTQIATLSACETGLGQFDEVDGISSFEGALRAAGSQTQVISMWEIDDASTREFMATFYKRALNGESTLQALRDTQLQMLQGKFSHPYYWAAFTHWGDWTPITCIRHPHRDGSVNLKSKIKLTVSVRDAATGHPISRASVGEDDYSGTLTNSSGIAIMNIDQEQEDLCEIENGKQSPNEQIVTVKRFGYEPFKEKLFLAFDQQLEVRLRRDPSVQVEGELARPAPSAPIRLSYINLYGAIETTLLLDSLDDPNRPTNHSDEKAIEFVNPNSQQLYQFWKTWRFRNAHPVSNPTWEQLFSDDSQFILYKSGVLLMKSSANPAIAQFKYSHSDGCGPANRGAGAPDFICDGPMKEAEAWDQIQAETRKVGFLMLFVENTSSQELNDVQISFRELTHQLSEDPIDAELADRKIADSELQKIQVPSMKPGSSIAWLVRVFAKPEPKGATKVISTIDEPMNMSYTVHGTSATVSISAPFVNRAADLHLPWGWYGRTY